MTEVDAALYDEDFYAWTQQQAALLRGHPLGRDNRVGNDRIAEEIEDLGKGELHACQSLCEHIIEHLLKIEYLGLADPLDHWRREIIEWRVQFERKQTRSIIAKLDLPDRYRVALRLLRYPERDMPGLITRVPAECPYSLEQILGGMGSGEEDWFPAPRQS